MERIEFLGDELIRRVPLLAQFREDLIATVAPLLEIAECHWADGAHDELTVQARGTLKQLLNAYVLPCYEVLGDAVGIDQLEKLEMYGQIGDLTEAVNGASAGAMSGGGKH